MKIILCGGGVAAEINNLVAMVPLAGKLPDEEAAEVIAQLRELEDMARSLRERVEGCIK